MTWADHHTQSERLAAEAELAVRQGAAAQAVDLYRLAAEAEARALAALDPTKTRTLGISEGRRDYYGRCSFRSHCARSRGNSCALVPYSRAINWGAPSETWRTEPRDSGDLPSMAVPSRPGKLSIRRAHAAAGADEFISGKRAADRKGCYNVASDHESECRGPRSCARGSCTRSRVQIHVPQTNTEARFYR